MTPASTSTTSAIAAPLTPTADHHTASHDHHDQSHTGGDEPLAHDHHPIAPAPLGTRIVAGIAIVVPPLALIAGIALLWGPGIAPVHLALLIGGYILTGLGITVGYHRLFTHKSFETNRVMTAVWGILGSMAVEGALFQWTGMHRRHHQHSDDEHDPHSPHTHGDSGIKGLLKGMWHSHVGWVFDPNPPELARYTVDLRKDKLLVFIDKFFLLWVALGLIIPGLIAWAVTGTVVGGLLGVLWGGLVRIMVVHHITWSVNSACHIWGSQPFNSHDHSRNNPIFGILAMGEGWHNNHHAFPTSARHGLAWWQFDLSYIVIRTMSFFKLTRGIRLPSKDRMEAKRAGKKPGRKHRRIRHAAADRSDLAA